jgi:hypothetical protein
MEIQLNRTTRIKRQLFGWAIASTLVGVSSASVNAQTSSGVTSDSSTSVVPAVVSSDSQATQLVSFNAISPEIGELIAKAKSQIVADKFPKPDVALADLKAKLERLSRFIDPNSENGKSWMRFLRWTELQAELEAAQPNINKLVELEMDMRQNYKGLELPEFANVRNSLNHYIRAVRYGRDPERTTKVIERQLDRLGERLQEAAAGSDIDREHEIGQIIDFLHDANQASELVAVSVSKFAKPNVRVLASDAFLKKRLGRPVSETSPVNEVILGTQIYGDSWVNGGVVPSLIANPHSANVRLLMNAHFSSNNVGTNRGVTICSQGSAEVCAAESLQLSESGLVLSGDTVSDANLNTTITGIEHRLKIVEKLAKKQVDKKQDLANAIGEQRLENRLRNQFHEQLGQQIAKANETLNRNFPVLKRVGLQKPARKSWTSNNFLALLWKSQDVAQLAATSSCPLPVPNHGVTIQVHQSAIYNAADTVMAGRRIRSTELDEVALQFGDKIPAHGEPWSITMADYHPIEVSFDDEIITFAIHTERSEKGDQSLDDEAKVIAKYKVEKQYGGIQLVRQGDVDVEFAGKADRGTRATILRSFLKNKFGKIFRENLFDRAVRLEEQLPDDVPDLTIDTVVVDDGWLQVTLN